MENQNWLGDNTETKFKCFIKEDEAEEFKRQLDLQAKFIGCWISTRKYKN